MSTDLLTAEGVASVRRPLSFKTHSRAHTRAHIQAHGNFLVAKIAELVAIFALSFAFATAVYVLRDTVTFATATLLCMPIALTKTSLTT